MYWYNVQNHEKKIGCHENARNNFCPTVKYIEEQQIKDRIHQHTSVKTNTNINRQRIRTWKLEEGKYNNRNTFASLWKALHPVIVVH